MTRGVPARRPSAAPGQGMAGGVVAYGLLAPANAALLTGDPPLVPHPAPLWTAVASVTLLALVGAYYGTLWYWILPYSPGTRRGRWALTGLFAVLAGLYRLWLTGTLTAALAASAFVVAGGVWLYRVARRRLGGSPFWPLRRVPDAVIVVAMAFALMVLYNPEATLTAWPAAGLLLPIGVAAAFRVRRRLAAAASPFVRAGADIVLSLLLGVAAAVAIVWAARLLRLTPTALAAVRGGLARVEAVAGVPGYLWLVLYLIPAVAAYALLPWRGAFARGIRVLRGVVIGQRTLNVVHLGLLLVAIAGLTVPPVLARSLHGPVRAGEAAQARRDDDAVGARAAYTAIRRDFTARARPDVRALAAVVARIHRVSPPPAPATGATTTERHLARRLGRLQGATRPGGPGPAAAPDAPIRDVRELRARLDRLDDRRVRVDQRTRHAHVAGALAAGAVAGLISVPEVGGGELVEIVRAYLGGLVEESPLRRAFSAWAAHRSGAPRPDAVRAVVPRPRALWRAAIDDLAREVRAARPRPPMPRVPYDRPLDAAVTYANQARYLAERTAPCAGCPPAGRLRTQRHDGRVERDGGGHGVRVRPGPFDVD